MTAVVVDLYDSGVLICDGNRILANSASFALIESDNTIIVGETAQQQAHIRPREISTQFWQQLSKTSNTKHVVSNAEIACRHLQYVWEQIEDQAYQVILAIPNVLTKQDLGLLLGICEKLCIAVAGIVSKSVLALHGYADDCRVVYLDILQQQIIITEILHKKSSISTSDSNLFIDNGIQHLTNNLAKHIAKKFIAETRFDPLHVAEDEQLFYDKLAMWLYQLESSDSIQCSLSSSSGEYHVEIHKDYLLLCNKKTFDAIANSLMSFAQDQKNVLIICSPTCLSIFGLLDHLMSLPGCAVKTLSHIDLAKQALLYENQISAKSAQIHYTTSLTDQDLASLDLNFNSGSLSDLNKKPTHLLINHHAYSLSQTNYLAQDKQGEITIGLECSQSSVCKITMNQFLVNVEKTQNVKLHLNGVEITQQQSVQIGDRLSINKDTNELFFINVN